MTKRKKVAFISICSGDKDLIAKWVASGDLPNIEGLLQTGLIGETTGLPGVYVGAHWPSFITACTPATNRVHSWEQLKPGTYDNYRCKAGDHMQKPQFWEVLSEAGVRSCVLDIPHSRISPDINGLQTVEWGAHDAAYGFRASSNALRQEIVSQYGLHPVSGNSDADRPIHELDRFADELVRGARMKGELSEDFVLRENWDFFAQVFTEAHCGGHLLWHLHDPDHIRHPEAVEAGVGDRLKDVYVAIDEGIGRILDRLDEDTTVIFLANHGIGPKYNADFLLPDILIALGVAAPADIPVEEPGAIDHVDDFITKAWQQLPVSFRDSVQPLRDRIRGAIHTEKTPPPKIKPSEGKCFFVRNNTAHAGIRVNLVGREPNGQIRPGAEYDAFLEELTSDLKGIINLDTGRAIVSNVYRCDDVYDGPERDHLPDLFVDWTNDAPIENLCSNKIGHVSGSYNYCRTGEHRPDGLFVVKGPGVAAGRIERKVTCIEFAPTIATLLGVELPDVEGTVIQELFTESQAVPRAKAG
ncbi:alkaline phosphatase family protein [Pelagibius sp. Alg239-R121]|uniref:alkaline phosphatase family protein n=1 Tax=Pelagibius sp. Alg239-R121 TaxID=2993448 RepID=UPI0024A6E1BE|nr:alkaline phosphatase family protein [Pelagibius sp. Alg239-R121]